MSSNSRTTQIALVSAVTALLLLTVVVNYLSTSQLGRDLGLFSNQSSTPWNQRGHLNDSSLTPPGWAFSVWGVIYTYLLASLVYMWTLLFRIDEQGDYLCTVDGLLPIGFLISHMASSVCNIVWIFLADKVDQDKPLLVPQTVAITALAVCLWVALGFSYSQLAKYRQDLYRAGLSLDYWLVIALVQNANAMYAGWVSVASLINLDIAIINLGNLSIAASGALCLSQLFGLAAAYICADFSFLDKWQRWILTPYLVAFWALIASVINNYNRATATTYMTIELLAILLPALIIKSVVSSLRQGRQDLRDSGRQHGNSFRFAKLQIT